MIFYDCDKFKLRFLFIFFVFFFLSCFDGEVVQSCSILHSLHKTGQNMKVH